MAFKMTHRLALVLLLAILTIQTNAAGVATCADTQANTDTECTACTTPGACTACNAGWAPSAGTCVTATYTTCSPVTGAFNLTPSAVIASNNTDWYNALPAGSFAAGTDNTTILYYATTTSGSGSAYTSTINRGVVNASSLSSISSKTAITGPSATTSSLLCTTGQGTYGCLSLLTTAPSTISDVQLSFVAESASTVTTKTLSAVGTGTDALTPQSLWYDDGNGVWYAVWSKATGDIYMQAVNTTNGTNALLYASGGVIVVAASVTATFQDINSNNVSNATTASLIYLTGTAGTNTGKINVIPITLATGTAGSAVTLSTDASVDGTASTKGSQTKNTFIGQFSSYSTTGVGIMTELLDCANVGAPSGTNICAGTDTIVTTSRTVYVFFNSTAPAGYNYTIGNTNSAGLGGFHFGNGFSILRVVIDTSTTYSYQNFFSNGTLNGTSTAVSLGTFGVTPDMFVDVNGALWLGYTNHETHTGLISDASLGKVFGQIYLFANSLSSVFIFAALLVTSLFTF